MSDEVIKSITAILTAIIGVAILAVIVGKGAQTSQVLSSGGSAFAKILQAAEGPVSGGVSSLNLNN